MGQAEISENIFKQINDYLQMSAADDIFDDKTF